MGPFARTSSLLAVVFACMVPAAHAEEPPAIVGRLDNFVGQVSLLPAGSETWIAASLNRPISLGDRLWVPQGGRAEILAGPDAVRIGPGSELGVLDLQERDMQLSLSRGTVELRVRDLGSQQRVEVDTPNLALQLEGAGDARLDVDPFADSTTVTLHDGQAVVFGDTAAPASVQMGQQVRFAGRDLTVIAAENDPPLDAFDHWVVERNRREDASISARYVSPWVTGYEGLDDWGTWQDNTAFGAVWFPRVPAGWVPYRDGHWAWIAPWGWTWIANEPWGFAPFHYGRWAWIAGSWAWVPGPVAVRPVYAPALVAFIAGGSFTAEMVNASAAVAWFPLAPGQLYRPPYAYTPAYLVAVNRCTAIRRDDEDFNVRRTVTPGRLPPQALTVVPRDVFVRGQPVRRATRPLALTRMQSLAVADGPHVQPQTESVLGQARPVPAPRGGPQRPVLATRQPVVPPALPYRPGPGAGAAPRLWPGHAVRVVPHPSEGYPRQRRVAPPTTVMPLERAGMVPPTPRDRALGQPGLSQPRPPGMRPYAPYPSPYPSPRPAPSATPEPGPYAPHPGFSPPPPDQSHRQQGQRPLPRPAVEPPRTLMPLERAGVLPPPQGVPRSIERPGGARLDHGSPPEHPAEGRRATTNERGSDRPSTANPLQRANMAP